MLVDMAQYRRKTRPRRTPQGAAHVRKRSSRQEDSVTQIALTVFTKPWREPLEELADKVAPPRSSQANRDNTKMKLADIDADERVRRRDVWIHKSPTNNLGAMP